MKKIIQYLDGTPHPFTIENFKSDLTIFCAGFSFQVINRGAINVYWKAFEGSQCVGTFDREKDLLEFVTQRIK